MHFCQECCYITLHTQRNDYTFFPITSVVCLINAFKSTSSSYLVSNNNYYFYVNFKTIFTPLEKSIANFFEVAA